MCKTSCPMLLIQPYQIGQAKQIADLFYQAVHAIDRQFYNVAQQEAWAPTPPNYSAWTARLADKQPMLAMMNNQVVGFIELEDDGHIDCLYVLPCYQHQGIATQLYQHAEDTAYRLGLSKLYVEASLVAKPFFLRQGFHVTQQNDRQLRGQVLINFSLEKQLEFLK